MKLKAVIEIEYEFDCTAYGGYGYGNTIPIEKAKEIDELYLNDEEVPLYERLEEFGSWFETNGIEYFVNVKVAQ